MLLRLCVLFTFLTVGCQSSKFIKSDFEFGRKIIVKDKTITDTTLKVTYKNKTTLPVFVNGYRESSSWLFYDLSFYDEVNNKWTEHFVFKDGVGNKMYSISPKNTIEFDVELDSELQGKRIKIHLYLYPKDNPVDNENGKYFTSHEYIVD